MSLRAEVICVGTELLLGGIVNTNATYFAQELAEVGIDLYYITTVGDNKNRIIDSLDLAFKRADVVITTGGLGPTEDDITHECIAEFLKVELEFHQDIAGQLEYFFKTIRKKEMPKSNLKQANLPKETVVLKNNYGTAPGIIYDQNGKYIFTFPGVPHEMKEMWKQTAKPYLQTVNPDKKIIKSKTLKFVGEGESAVAEMVHDFLNNPNPTVAPYAGRGEVRLRITSKAENEEVALSMIEPIEKEIKKRLNKFFYGYEEDSLHSVISKYLLENKKTISVSEILTNGSLIQRLNSLENSGDFFPAGFVFNNKKSIKQLLEVGENILNNNELFSESLLTEVSQKTRSKTKTDFNLTISTNFQKDEKTNQNIGHIIMCLSGENINELRTLKYTKVKKEDLDYYASQFALNLFRLECKER